MIQRAFILKISQKKKFQILPKILASFSSSSLQLLVNAYLIANFYPSKLCVPRKTLKKFINVS